MKQQMLVMLAISVVLLAGVVPGYAEGFTSGARVAPGAGPAPGARPSIAGRPGGFRGSPGFRRGSALPGGIHRVAPHPPAFRPGDRFPGHPRFRREDFHRHDGFHHGFHHGFAGPRVFIGPTFWWGPPWYGPTYAAPPVIVQATPPVYVPETPAAPPAYWYYCQNPQGYHPYVKECPGGWTQVTPQPPPPAP